MRKRWMGALAALGLVVCVSDATACHNGVEIRVVPLTRLVSQSSAALSGGQNERAVGLAGRAVRRIRTRRRSERTRLLMLRAKEVLATATIRLDGAVDRESFRVAHQLSVEERRDAMLWAVGILEHRYTTERGPRTMARYAEGIGRFPTQRERAFRILQGLHRTDVMPDAHGYRALAELSTDPEQRAEALVLCRRRAGARADRLCHVGES